ncbi:hypothetical protein Leryth_024019 [Lithospermum erythrorhizon]|nr:hypothetical protein Leryth_024019 [Lithospermum erythrorhizon]
MSQFSLFDGFLYDSVSGFKLPGKYFCTSSLFRRSLFKDLSKFEQKWINRPDNVVIPKRKAPTCSLNHRRQCKEKTFTLG